jgi:hypothetical protein
MTTFYLVSFGLYVLATFVLACKMSWDAGKNCDSDDDIDEAGITAGDVFRVQLKFLWKTLTLPAALFKAVRKAKA